MLHWTGNKEVDALLLLLLLLLPFILPWSNLSISNVEHVSRAVWSIFVLFQGYNRKTKFIATQGMKRFPVVFFVTPCLLLHTWSELKNGCTYVIIIMQITNSYLSVKSTWQEEFDSCKWKTLLKCVKVRSAELKLVNGVSKLRTIDKENERKNREK